MALIINSVSNCRSVRKWQFEKDAKPCGGPESTEAATEEATYFHFAKMASPPHFWQHKGATADPANSNNPSGGESEIWRTPGAGEDLRQNQAFTRDKSICRGRLNVCEFGGSRIPITNSYVDTKTRCNAIRDHPRHFHPAPRSPPGTPQRIGNRVFE